MRYELNDEFSDEKIEDICTKTALNVVRETNIQNPDDNKVIFYDGFGLVERGFANIYVRALCKLGYSVYWILYDFSPEYKDILDKYKNSKNVEFCVIEKIDIMTRMKVFKNIIQEISPKHIFIYSTPSDVAGLGVLSTIKGNVSRYLIDLTDHAYWLGVNATDYIVGFRDNGCTVAKNFRKGTKQPEVVMLPYYPDSRKYEFEGLPFDVNDEFIFSGGNTYKIQGSDKYEKTVSYLLNKHQNLKFVYASSNKIEKLLRLKDEFPNRVYLIDERKDLDQILQYAKYYMHTYPICGGLMVQYAVQNECVPIGLCDDIGGLADPSTILIDAGNLNVVFDEEEDLYEYVDALEMDNQKYEEVKRTLKGRVISEEKFTEQLSKLLTEHKTDYQIHDTEVQLELFRESYFERMTFEKYRRCILESGNPWIKEKFGKDL